MFDTLTTPDITPSKAACGMNDLKYERTAGISPLRVRMSIFSIKRWSSSGFSMGLLAASLYSTHEGVDYKIDGNDS